VNPELPFQVVPREILQAVPQRPGQVNQPQTTGTKNVILHKIIDSLYIVHSPTNALFIKLGKV